MMRNKKHIALISAALALLLVLSAGRESIALAAQAASDTLLTTTPSGTLTKTNQKATIDYSNTSDGYVMVKFTASTSYRVKVLVMGPNTSTDSTRYQYDLPVGQWVTFPLSDGSGKYTVKVMEQKSNGKYGVALDASFNVALTDEFAPYIRPNQDVNYSDTVSPNTLAKAKELCDGVTDPLVKVSKVYEYVVKNLTYDKAKAENVKSGYLPVLDDVLAAKKGICFDYAALMSGMLRSQGVPCKLVTGYVSTGGYHAWISVWTEKDGWIDNAIYFDGTTWHRMDPTFASSGGGSDDIVKYIGNGSNYTIKNSY